MPVPIRACTFAVSLLKTINFCSFVGFVSGFLVLVFVLATTTNQRRAFDSVELPMPNISNVVVDAEGRILVNNVAYGRVQIYDQTGRLLRGFFSVAPMEPSLIGFDADGNIAVVTHRGDRISVFAKDGSLLSEKFGGRKINSEWEKKTAMDAGQRWSRVSDTQQMAKPASYQSTPKRRRGLS